MPSGPLPPSPSSSGQLPAQMPSRAPLPALLQAPPQSTPRTHRARAPLAQNNMLLWAMFAVLTVIVAALVEVILALVSRK